jgi:hypothetical protein
METVISVLIIVLVIMLICFFSSLIDHFLGKRKEQTFEKYFRRVEQHVGVLTDMHKVGPWYLVVFTTKSPYPIWISNNNIRSVHPDPKDCRLTVKQFNGEDMVIDDVESYDLQSASEMTDFDFQ